jgi:hypothetical protein
MADREKTVKELQDELSKQGFDEKALAGIRTKDALIATLTALKAKSKVATLNPPKDPKEEKDTEKAWQTKADKFSKHLEKQPKVRVLIPLEVGEKVGNVKKIKIKGIMQYRHISGAVWSKTFNGFRVILPKGIYTEVPEQIADNIAKELDQTQRAGEHLKIDRIDPQTGKPVRDQLT